MRVVTGRLINQHRTPALTSFGRLLMAAIVAVALSISPASATYALGNQAPPPTAETASLAPDALQRLLAPIALYPDSLVAQILAASTYPGQIVEADRWLQQHQNLKDEKLAEEVDKQQWDPSVKALTAFPSVLANLDTNLSWTSSLGEAYFNQQQDVLDTVQVLRARARTAGNLQSTPQETVTSQGATIIIEPANPDICYVPLYNPLIVYGAPIGIYPGYLYDYPIGGPYLSFGIGFGIGPRIWGRFGWGFHSWNCNWRDHSVFFNHNIYVSNSPAFFHRFPGRIGNFPGGATFPGNNRFGDRTNRGPVFSGGDPRLPPGVRERDPTLPPGVRDRNPTLPPGTFHEPGFGQPGSNSELRSRAFDGIGPDGIGRGAASDDHDSFNDGFGRRGGRGGFRGFGGRVGGGHGGGRH